MVNSILGSSYDLTQRLNQMERNIRDLSTQPILRNASTGQSGGQGLSTDINGLHLFNPSGTETVTLSTLDGSATFGGNVVINGNLAVPNGSISNAALQSPLTVASVNATQTNFSTALTYQNLAATSINVPAGYSQAIVSCTVSVMAMNSASSLDYIFLSANINGTLSFEMPGTAGASSASDPVTTSLTQAFTGLSGGTIPVAAAVHTQGNVWGANATNRAYCAAFAVFLR